MKPALLVIDVQNEWLDKSPELKKCVEQRAASINRAIDWFRSKTLPVIAVYHEDKKKGPVRGTRNFEFADIISIRDSDFKVVKHFPNSFARTGLEKILKENGCDSVALSGLSATWCVLATYFGAIDRDMTPHMLRGCLADSSRDNVQFAEEGYEAIALEKLEQLMA